MVVHPEDEYPFKSFFQAILHDIVHHLLAGLIKTSSVIVDHVLKVIDPVRQNLENHSNFLFEVFELLVVQVHDLIVGENLQHLLVKILGNSIHKQNGSRIGVAVAARADLTELIEDQINGFPNLVQTIGRKKLVNWEVPKKSVVVLGSLQLLFKTSVVLETENNGDHVSLLK